MKLGAILVFLTATSSALAAPGPLNFQGALALAQLPAPIPVDSGGKLKSDLGGKWSKTRDPEGTELLAAKGSDAKVAIMREKSGGVEALISYVLKPSKDKNSQPEASAGFFFKKGQVAALTTCEDSAEKDSLGRICVTATERLCSNLRSGAGADIEVLGEVETFETRALASILTLRGSDHQLENVVKSGNRLGLKSALQTTKGQLMALAKQISKELGHAPPEPAPSGEPSEQRRVRERAITDNLLAKNVLEKSLPRLKQACLDARF